MVIFIPSDSQEVLTSCSVESSKIHWLLKGEATRQEAPQAPSDNISLDRQMESTDEETNWMSLKRGYMRKFSINSSLCDSEPSMGKWG